jgi:hypothetical protein
MSGHAGHAGNDAAVILVYHEKTNLRYFFYKTLCFEYFSTVHRLESTALRAARLWGLQASEFEVTGQGVEALTGGKGRGGVCPAWAGVPVQSLFCAATDRCAMAQTRSSASQRFLNCHIIWMNSTCSRKSPQELSLISLFFNGLRRLQDLISLCKVFAGFSVLVSVSSTCL